MVFLLKDTIWAGFRLLESSEKGKRQNTNKKLQQAAKPNQVKKNFKQNKQEKLEMRNTFYCNQA